ncbi:MAG: hypothetical protein M1150_04610 [Patescibacteria group bacterium]|nr:hypothetical protein [Patescibacteria group bacterium]
MALLKWGGNILPKAYVVAENPKERKVLEKMQFQSAAVGELDGQKCLIIPAVKPMGCITCIKKQLHGFRPKCKNCPL